MTLAVLTAVASTFVRLFELFWLVFWAFTHTPSADAAAYAEGVANKPESFSRFAARGAAIGVALVALFVVVVLLLVLYALPEGWNT